jgi:hypothetical protein
MAVLLMLKALVPVVPAYLRHKPRGGVIVVRPSIRTLPAKADSKQPDLFKDKPRG